MRKGILVFGVLLVGVGINLVSLSIANAQDSSSNEFTLEEITVTAQKRAENAQTTPISIAYTSGSEAIEMGMSNVGDVLQNIPSVHIEPIAKGASINIRGLGGTLDPQIGSPAVNFNIDGRYQQQSAATYSAFYDVNRVEVLRGPQGTLFGRNATAGSVNVITNDPKNKFDANATFQFGNYSLIRSDSMINVPVNDSSALRLAMSIEKHDGYLTTGNNDADNKSVRAKYLYKPNEDFRLLLAADRSSVGGFYGTVLAPLNARSNAWESIDPKGQSDVETWSTSAQVDWNIGFADFTFIPSFQSYRLDSDTIWASAQEQMMHPTEKQTSIEARFASRPGEPIKWLLGAYYLESNKTDDVSIPELHSHTVYPEINLTSYAGFGQINMPFGEQFEAYLGLRYTRDNSSNKGILYGANPFTGEPINTGYFSSSGEWNSTDYRVGIDINVSEGSLIYAQIATGYKAGGFYQGAPPNTFKPEKLMAYQIGSKNRFLGNRLQINGEAFYYDYKDYQVQNIGMANPASAGVFGLLIYNAGKATLYGGELESAWLFSSVDKFDVSVSYLHSQFDTLVIPASPPLSPVDAVYSGQQMPNSPTWSGKVAYEHDWILSSGAALIARGEVTFSAGFYPSFQQYPGTYQDKHTISNLFLGYQSENGKYSVRTYVKNIGNEPVMNSAYQLAFRPTSVMLNTPRTYGVTLSVNY